MNGISSKALAFGGPENKKKFNDGTELNTDFDLSWYETDFRSYDPQIGKFWQIDAMADYYEDWSPYTFALNNPILFNDPTGLASETPRETSTPDKPKELAPVVVTGVRKKITIPAGLTMTNTPGTLMKPNPNYVPNARAPQNQGKYIPVQTRACVNGCVNPGHPDHNHEGGEIYEDIIIEVVTLGIPVSKLRHLRLAKFLAKRGKTVLGKFPDYINLANKLNAKRFNIPTEIWAKMTAEQQWAANVKFLERMIARGDEIILSNPVKDINKVTGAFRRELDYLIEKGFKISSDGASMIK